MKGTITRCIKQLVCEKFDEEKYLAILKEANIDESEHRKLNMPTTDIPDEDVVRILGAATKVLGITNAQLYDVFGEYWVSTYAANLYKGIYAQFSSAKEMILGMDEVHIFMTQNMPNAHPPRFDYEWQNDNTLIVTYKSDRGLVSVYAGLVRGVGKHFNETLDVTEIGNNKVKVVFH